ncbi:GNAT family N-acetyltransferase [Ruegeria arenilitoris]|uniref:Acetyltransferase (GNAT) family protein n=1 Tax=Ruegeria arenilitoris TaxID=1173585 RepID=A0A238KF26_9RHOB|nr:GNAT family N-acetyltransferase [Ruegeria arenilitoris]SMX41398.1 Acetyltransferase (GNAT) family protein [Ruegeria arenilitoris]
MTVSVSRGFSPDERARAAELFWQAFSGKLSRVMGPDARGLAFFERVLNPEFALVARDADGRMLGLAGYKTRDGGLTQGGLADLARVYGWFGALWRGLILSVLERDLKPGVFQMDGICVAAEARGQGVGTLLLGAIKDEAQRLGMHEVHLDVIDTNPRARILYEREGFQVIGQDRTGPFKHLLGFSSATKMRWVVTDGG